MIYLIQVSICTAIFYLPFHFLFQGKGNHGFNRFYLLGALLLSLLIPLLHIPLFPEYIDLNLQAINTVPFSELEQGSPAIISWENILLLIYGAGVLVSSANIGRSLLRLFGTIQSGKKERGKGFTKVYTSSGIPVSSFFSYLFIPMEKKGIITDFEISHELCHIREKHTVDVLFVELFKAFIWFNPFAYLYKKRLVEVHEFLADQQVSKKFGKEGYEAFLIRQVSSGKQPFLVHNFYSLFKKRIDMMNFNPQGSRWQYLLVLPIFAIALSLFSFESYPVYIQDGTDKNTLPGVDTLPPKPTKLIMEMVDTVIVFDPATGEETIQIVKSTRTIENSNALGPESPSTGIDTLITFDPATFKETVIIINHDTGVMDTLR